MPSASDIAKETRVPEIIAGTLIPTILGSIFALARFYSRAVIMRNWGSDDTCILIAWICSLGLAVVNIMFTSFGVGHHLINPATGELVADLTPGDLISTLKASFSAQLLYQFILFMTKLGICLFYLRIFEDRASKITAYCIIGFLLATFVPLEFVVIFRCKPVEDWFSLAPNTNCGPQNPILYASTILNIVGDALLMAFVLPRFVALKMLRQYKISLVVVVSLGFLVIAAASTRLARVVRLTGNPDLPWEASDITTWSSVEVHTGIFCASAPAIRPVLRKVLPGFMSSQGNSRPSQNRSRSKSKGTPYDTSTRNSKYGIRDIEAIALQNCENDENILESNGSSFATAFYSRSASRGSIVQDENKIGAVESLRNDDIVKTTSVTVTESIPHSDRGIDPNTGAGVVEHIQQK